MILARAAASDHDEAADDGAAAQEPVSTAFAMFDTADPALTELHFTMPKALAAELVERFCDYTAAQAGDAAAAV